MDQDASTQDHTRGRLKTHRTMIIWSMELESASEYRLNPSL